jgi:Carboxypeptidase regulatory-like domain
MSTTDSAPYSALQPAEEDFAVTNSCSARFRYHDRAALLTTLFEVEDIMEVTWRTLSRNTALFVVLLFATSICSYGQQDQGAIQGTITDSSGALIPNANVALTNTDQGLVLKTTTDGRGVYFFSPIKIGDYSVSATAAGFKETTQQDLHVDAQQRLNVNLTLTPGAQSQTVIVNAAPPVLQTEEASVGQVYTSKQLDEPPLIGRNWVFIAQLGAGAAPSSGARGAGTGDFAASGSRSDENNFILDGVDNNVNVVDFLNGASFNVNPPPDAMAEVKIQTSSYSAEFGHSSGAVINASLKSGTNSIHGSLWEYLRNNALNAHQYFDSPGQKKAEYRQNLFGGTLGGPIVKNHLFIFGDIQGDRIVNGNNIIETVPTPLERQGNFSELLNPQETGGAPIYLYQQQSGGGPNPQAPGSTPATAVPYQQVYNGQLNVLNPAAVDPLAESLLNLYPLPNRVNSNSNGLLNNNYTTPIVETDNTVQWDVRVDYNMSARDQAFVRNSYNHEYEFWPSPLGQTLDGGSFSSDGDQVNIGDNFAASETHVFTPHLLNEVRYGYNYGHFYFTQPNATDVGFAASLGLGGIPEAPLNGGLPNTYFYGQIAGFGAPNYYPSNEHEYIWQVLDNVTFDIGNHSLKAGFDIQRIRFGTLQPPAGHGDYNYTGGYSSAYTIPNTGFSVADFLSDNQNNGSLTSINEVDDIRWDRSVYIQDDWKVTPKLTINLGLRAENQSPYYERQGLQANFYPTEGVTYNPSIGQQGQSSSAGVYVMPEKSANTPLPAAFLSALTEDNISVKYSNNHYLLNYPIINWGPRFGISYQLDHQSVIRAGYGLFYGGLESVGFAPNLGLNYPFTQRPGLTNPGNLPCIYSNGCLTDGISLETGYTAFLADGGLSNFVGTPSLNGISNNIKTPQTNQFNVSIERVFGRNFTATIGYVGSLVRDATNFPNLNSAPVITPQCNSAGVGGQPTNTPCGTGNSQNPFPNVNIEIQDNNGEATYHSLQTKLEKRLSNNLSFLATYTFSKSMSDAGTSIAQGDNFTSAGGPANYNIFGTRQGYARSPEDVRERFTFLGNYTLPFGKGQRYLNRGGFTNQVLGGWQVSLSEQIQDGEPFTVGTANITGVNNLGQNAILIRSPFQGGGTPDPSLNFPAGATCPAQVHRLSSWFNPCSFKNPLPGSAVTTALTSPSQVRPFLGDNANQVDGVGYNRTNMSVFKSFPIYHQAALQFRADIYNVFNSPAFIITGGNDGPSGGVIGAGSYRFFQNDTPNSRIFQFSLRASF